MTRFLLRAAALAVFAMLAGCASQPEIPFDRTSGDIKTIGVLSSYIQAAPTVILASDMGQSFGLVGALVDAKLQEVRSGKLEGMLVTNGVHPFVVFTDGLKTALAAENYRVVDVPVARPKAGFLKTYPKSAGIDAYLDVTFIGAGYGYIAAGMSKSSPYRPYVYVNCRLIRASDGSVLMQDIVLYNPVNGADVKAVTISPDPEYAYADMDALEAHGAEVAKGMVAALDQTSKVIAGLIH